MTCKLCGEPRHWRRLCLQHARNFRYEAFRRWLENKQRSLGAPVSQRWARKPRGEMKKEKRYARST